MQGVEEHSPSWGGLRGWAKRRAGISAKQVSTSSREPLMRPTVILTALIALISCVDKSAEAHAECLSSPNAVWAAHPGSHATWRLRLTGHEGVKCWFVRGSRNVQAPRIQRDLAAASRRGTVHHEADRRSNGASAVNRPDERPARSEPQAALPPHQRVPSSILMWGTPMQIDATWEEIFKRRERRTQ